MYNSLALKIELLELVALQCLSIPWILEYLINVTLTFAAANRITLRADLCRLRTYRTGYPICTGNNRSVCTEWCL